MLCYKHTFLFVTTTMLEDRSFEILDRARWLKLAQDKIAARQQLL